MRYYSDGHHTWRIEELEQLAGPVQYVSVQRIQHLQEARRLALQTARILESDQPVLLGPDGEVLEGHERLARALINGDQTVEVRRVPWMPEPLTSVENK